MNTPNKLSLTIAGLALTGLLASCGGTSTPADTSAPAPETTTAAPATSAAAPSASSAPDSTTAANPDMSMEAGYAAIALAEAEVPGGRATELDWSDDDSWEVEVIVGDRKHEFDISADGTTITERDEDDADSDDVDRLASATVSLTEAIQTAMAAVPGEFDDADLSTEDGVVVWEINLDDPDDVEVYVDASSGEVIKP